MKKAILIIGVLIISFVVVDYCELLFPVVHSDGMKDVYFQFKISDLKSGNLITEVTIKSPYGEHGRERPVQRKVDRTGTIRGTVGVGWSCNSTLLFRKESSLKDRLIEFVFMHPSYQTNTKTFSVKELKKTQIITLQPVKDTP